MTKHASTTTSSPQSYRGGRFQMARSRGAVTGPLLMLLGAWGALIPFFGHSFSFGFTPDNTWHWTAARGWLEVLPGAVTFVAGALLTNTTQRANAMLASWIAVAAGAWFVVGTTISPYWNAGAIGTPSGSAHRGVWERLAMFDGLGVVIVLMAAIAIGRVSVVGLRDVEAAAARDEAARIDLTRTETATSNAATTDDADSPTAART